MLVRLHSFGRDRVRQALTDTIALLDTIIDQVCPQHPPRSFPVAHARAHAARIHTQTLELMNKGTPLNTIIHTVKIPADLLQVGKLMP